MDWYVFYYAMILYNNIYYLYFKMDWYVFYYAMILAGTPDCTLSFDDFIDECDTNPALVTEIQNYLDKQFQMQEPSKEDSKKK